MINIKQLVEKKFSKCDFVLVCYNKSQYIIFDQDIDLYFYFLKRFRDTSQYYYYLTPLEWAEFKSFLDFNFISYGLYQLEGNRLSIMSKSTFPVNNYSKTLNIHLKSVDFNAKEKKVKNKKSNKKNKLIKSNPKDNSHRILTHTQNSFLVSNKNHQLNKSNLKKFDEKIVCISKIPERDKKAVSEAANKVKELKNTHRRNLPDQEKPTSSDMSAARYGDFFRY